MNNDFLINRISILFQSRNEKPTPGCVNAGVGKDFMTNLKKGQSPSVEKVQLLAQYLDVTVSELLGEVDPGDSMDKNLGWDDRWVLEHYYAHRNDSVEELVHSVMTNTQMWGRDLTEVEGFEALTVKNLKI